MPITTDLYHGAHGGNGYTAGAAHVGQCWTERRVSAEAYTAGSRKATLWVASVDLSDLIVEMVDDYDRDSDAAPGDSEASIADLVSRGVDVVLYEDEDQNGRRHDTVRIVSERARAMVAAAMTQIEAESPFGSACGTRR